MSEVSTAESAVEKRRANLAKARAARKPGSHKHGFSIATMSRDVRLGLLISLNYGGGSWPETMAPPPGVSPNAIDFWLKLKRRSPAKYAECLMKLVRNNDGASTEGMRIVVQQLTIQAGPVAGVLASPVLQHVQAARLVPHGGEVVDMEPQT